MVSKKQAPRKFILTGSYERNIFQASFDKNGRISTFFFAYFHQKSSTLAAVGSKNQANQFRRDLTKKWRVSTFFSRLFFFKKQFLTPVGSKNQENHYRRDSTKNGQVLTKNFSANFSQKNLL